MNSQKIKRLWEESKTQHRIDVGNRLYKYRKVFHQWRYMMFLLHMFLPSIHLKLYRHRGRMQRKVFSILNNYIPFIEKQLRLKVQNFHKWELENNGPNLCVSNDTIQTGKDIDMLIDEAVKDMMEELHESRYNIWFHSVEDPRIFIENPYPGYLDVRRACNYCQQVMKSFAYFF